MVRAANLYQEAINVRLYVQASATAAQRIELGVQDASRPIDKRLKRLGLAALEGFKHSPFHNRARRERHVQDHVQEQRYLQQSDPGPLGGEQTAEEGQLVESTPGAHTERQHQLELIVEVRTDFRS